MCVQEKGWMDGHLMKRWIRDVWIAHTQRRKALLVMYSFRAHCTEDIQDVLARANSEISFIPGGCTSKLQPLDVSLNKPFKTILCRKSFSNFCRSQLSAMSAVGRGSTQLPVRKAGDGHQIIPSDRYLSCPGWI